MNSKRVSDIITKEEITKWRKGEIITIKAGTGAGKSYWCKNVLYEYAKEHGLKILMLVPRTNCLNQFVAELEDSGRLDDEIITIRTYQWLEALYKSTSSLNLSKYDYIVCDEYHYFVNDSSFNITTDMSFEQIMNSKATKIMMSATGDFMNKYIKTIGKIKTIDYELPIKYDNFKNIWFYQNPHSIDTILKLLKIGNEVNLICVHSAQKCYELYLKYKDDAVFCCGSSSPYYKHVDTEEIDNILTNEKFNKKFFFVTECFDIGITLKDVNLKNIVIDGVYDIDTIKQFLGRKRSIDKDDIYTDFFLYCPSINSLAGKLPHLNKDIEVADFLIQFGSKLYVDKYSKERIKKEYIYDKPTKNGYEKEVNLLMYCKKRLDIERYTKAINMGGFNKYIVKELNIKKYNMLEKIIGVDNVRKFLNRNIGKRLYKEQQKELIEMVNLKDKYGRLQKSINILNQYLIDNFDMTLSSKKFRVDGKLKTAWILSKLE